ncbi:hypothetical protein KJ969_05695 [Patescibacteria group bacterium]|nr:hypothetical protein [Patescibacteria group bacterium]
MKKFSVIAVFAMFALVCANASAGDKAKKGIDVSFSQEQVTKLCNEQVKVCDEKLQVCGEEKDVSEALRQECDGELKQCKNYLKDCYPDIVFEPGESVSDAVAEARKITPKPPKPEKKKKDKDIKPPPLPDQRKCTDYKNLNGLYTYAEGGWHWTEEYCGVKAAMDGHCLTVKQLYFVGQCLADKMEAFEQRLKDVENAKPVVIEAVDTGDDFVTPEQFQQTVNNLTLMLEQLEASNTLRDEKLEGFADELAELKDRVRSLEFRVSKIEACLRKDPEFLDLDEDGEISYDEYKSRCGILAEIPKIKKTLAELKFKDIEQDAILDDHELRITVLEKQRQAAYKMGPSAGAILVGMARGDVFLGGVLHWDILTVLHDGHDAVSFAVFIGGVDGVSSGEYSGFVYGGSIMYSPGPQSIFSLGLGYTGLSTGVSIPERNCSPEQARQDPRCQDPDRQDHIMLGKIKVKYDVRLKKSLRTLFTFGAQAGLGAAYTDCSKGHGWNLAYEVTLFLGFPFILF